MSRRGPETAGDLRVPVPPDPERLARAAREVVADGSRIRDWAFHAAAARRTQIGARDGRIGNAHAPVSTGESASARYLVVWDDGRVSRGTLERRQIEDDPVDALRRARDAAIDDPDAAHVLGPASFPDVELLDPRCAGIAAGDEPALLLERLTAIRDAAGGSGATTWSGSVGATVAAARLITSAGLEVAGAGTSFGWGASLEGRTGDGWSSRVEDDADAFAARLDGLVRRFDLLRRPADPPTPGVVPVVLHPDVVEAYVLPALFHNLAGSTVDHGEGAFARADFGSDRPVLREDLAVRIDPLLPLRSGSYRFSSEGVPSARCAFVERGCAVRPMADVKYARRLGVEPSPLALAWDVVAVEGPAELRLADAIAASAATVVSVLGVHTQDFGSGDFSLAAPQILRHRDGDAVGRIRGTLAGNLFDLLRSPDLARVPFPGETTPGLLVPVRLDAERP